MFDYSEIFEFCDKKFIQDELDCLAKQNLDLFEDSIKETIEKFEKKYNIFCKKENEIAEEILRISNLNEESEKSMENTKEFDQRRFELYEKQSEYHIERYWINQQLRSLSEMLIINAFKNIEINIKTLIKLAYPNVSSKELYKWESLIQFFKSKDIELAKLPGYQKIIKIKNVNNSLKHGGLINDAVKKIEEFKEQQEYDFVNLINFYEKVKGEIPNFLTELSSAIKEDLFSFNENRIEQITKEYKLRMNDENLKMFIQKLSKK